MRKRQSGLTAIGFIVLAALVGMVGYGGIRLVPVYMTQMQIRQLLNNLKSDNEGNHPSPTQLRAEIARQLNVDAVNYPRAQDFTITKSDTGYVIAISYEDSVPYIANLSLVASFDNSVEIGN